MYYGSLLSHKLKRILRPFGYCCSCCCIFLFMWRDISVQFFYSVCWFLLLLVATAVAACLLLLENGSSCVSTLCADIDTTWSTTAVCVHRVCGMVFLLLACLFASFLSNIDLVRSWSVLRLCICASRAYNFANMQWVITVTSTIGHSPTNYTFGCLFPSHAQLFKLHFLFIDVVAAVAFNQVLFTRLCE